jgi:hypothetical protein
MRSEFRYAFFALLLCLFAAVPIRAQSPAQCATIHAQDAVFGAPFNGIADQPTPTVTQRDGNGFVLGENFGADVTCVAQSGAPVTSGSKNPLVIGAIGQDTFPDSCVPATYPGGVLPPGCPSDPLGHNGYCPPLFVTTALNTPTLFSASSPPSFTMVVASQTVTFIPLVPGFSCAPVSASATSICTGSACALKSIAVTQFGTTQTAATVEVGSTVRFQATGTFSDGSTHDVTNQSSAKSYTGQNTTWSTGNTNIATVSSSTPSSIVQQGIVTGVAAGATGVNAVNGSISGMGDVAVFVVTGGGGTGGCTGSGDPNQPQSKNSNCSPIILDLNGKGFFLTSGANGVQFDISGTGHPVQIAWTAASADNAFLALPGADGLVHTGKELFGNFTPQPPSDTPNGFAALAVYDLPANGGNGDGVIDARDKIFASLRLWIDANHDGICQPDELYTLPSMGVNSISLHYKLSEKTDQYGNVFRYRAGVNPDDPDASHVDRKAYDVFFVTLGQPTSQLMPKKSAPLEGQKSAAPASGRQGMLSAGGL